MMRLTLSMGTLFLIASINAQIYDDYVGAGHADGIEVTTSSNYQAFGWDVIASGDASINGSGLDADIMEATRFLAQSTMGFEAQHLDETLELGIEAWIDAQVDKPYVSQYDRMYEIIEQALELWTAQGNDPEEYFYPGFQHFQYAWWQTNMTNEDLLRQRVAMALSEILVVSLASNLEEHVDGVAVYHDILLENAFGNYRDLLEEVSLSPTMGVYLSHFNNPLNIDSLNVHPDENYAREIMQLFSIGLYELNIDGTYALDVDGDPIPTYGIYEIKELAKIFTGLGPGAVIENIFVDEPYFGLTRYLCDFTEPMTMYEEFHEPGPKTLLNGFTIPGGQSGMADIQDALDHLFDHPNVGPFIGRKLIQNMVKSNPTPGYIQRVAEAFNDNGQGVRGDMLAVVKAVLLDEEARTCEWIQNPEQGKLIPPFYRYSYFSRNVDKLGPENLYWNVGYSFFENTEQIPFASRTVFNFYLPDFQPNGQIADQELVAPEFQIHNSRTSIGYLNEVTSWTWYWALMYPWDNVEPVFVSFNDYEELARDPEVLINELDRIFTHGQMTEEFRQNLKETMSGFTLFTAGPAYLEYRARLALFMIMVGPDYVILK
ncbi:MAG: DUF1800 family protein [Flavobacteriales bacterium]|nr:DUF1800 family protein [Flavobacteriales bacterium]NNK80962.1 DUF1800 family protein [Flavobacteriales bacterium]